MVGLLTAEKSNCIKHNEVYKEEMQSWVCGLYGCGAWVWGLVMGHGRKTIRLVSIKTLRK